jgi:hypothetical protein
MRVGGWVAFHDSDPSWPGVWRTWREYGMKMLTDHEYNSSISCGRVPANKDTFSLPLPSEIKRTPWPYAAEFALYLREHYPQWQEFTDKIFASLDFGYGRGETLDQDGQKKLASAIIATMPYDAQQILVQIKERKEHEDPVLNYWSELAEIALGLTT